VPPQGNGQGSPVDEGGDEDVDAHDPPEEHGDEEVGRAPGIGVEARAGAGARGVHAIPHDFGPAVPRDERQRRDEGVADLPHGRERGGQ
jgi:hypothetical protein